MYRTYNAFATSFTTLRGGAAKQLIQEGSTHANYADMIPRNRTRGQLMRYILVLPAWVT
jgi:hypothetical protein